MANRKRKRIKAGQINKGSSEIRPRFVEELNEEFSFSLKYLDKSSSKFNYNDKDCTYYCAVLHRLQDLCKEKVSSIIKDPNKRNTLRLHKINWADKRVSENKFSGLDEQLQDYEPWQFQISSNKHGRVHGFFIESTFYVVWLDPDHLLYPGKK